MEVFDCPRNLRNQRLIVGACILGGLLCAGALYLEATGKRLDVVGRKVATVVTLEPRVRRRNASRYVWEAIRPGDAIYYKDAIQVGNGGMANLSFMNGAILEMSANSLVVLDDPSDVALNLVKGNFIVREKDKDRQIKVKAKGRKPQVKSLTARLLLPPNNEKIYFSESKKHKVTFRWKTVGGNSGKEIKLEFTKDRSFRKKLEQISLSPEVSQHEEKLSPGTYYWRLSSNKTSLTETRKFTLIQPESIVPRVPSAASPLKLLRSSQPVAFEWNVPEMEPDISAKHQHFLEIASDPSFNERTASHLVSILSGRAMLSGLTEGTHFWRIRSQYGSAKINGPASKFVVQPISDIPVSLDVPKKDAIFAQSPVLRFRWTSLEATRLGAKFRFVLEKIGDPPLVQMETKASSFLWRRPEMGNFRWRVESVIEEETIGSSQWWHFRIFGGEPIALIQPKNQSKILFWEKASGLRFNWVKDELSDDKRYRYRILLARDREFTSQVIDKEVDVSRYAVDGLNLNPGFYFWKVLLENEKGRAVKQSSIQKFYYGHYPRLLPPSKVLPDHNATVNILMSKPKVSWSAVPNATAYEVILMKDRQIILKKRTKKLSLALAEVEAGTYLWTIRTVDRLNRTGEARSPQTLNLTYGETLGAPEIIDPLEVPEL